MVQPVIARAFMADGLATASGFLPRFLICEPPSAIGKRFHANVRRDDQALAAFAARLGETLDAPMPMDPKSRALDPRSLALSSRARVILVAFSDAIEAQQAPGKDLAHVTGYASKAAEQACRIAALLTLWDDLNAREVTAEAMGRGIALAQFYLSEAARLADGVMVSQEIERAETLRKWLLESWLEDVILPRDVVRLAPIRALRESPKAKAALALLEGHGWLVRLPEGTVVRGAARKEAYKIVRPDHVV